MIDKILNLLGLFACVLTFWMVFFTDIEIPRYYSAYVAFALFGTILELMSKSKDASL